jgi:hypothetical protein
MQTYRVPWEDAPRWTPPQDEDRPRPQAPNVSPMRQVNAPPAPPSRPVVLPPANVAPMRQINEPIIPTTHEPPPVPMLRNAAAAAPIAPPLLRAGQAVFGALPGLVETAKRTAPVVMPALLEASPVVQNIRRAVTGLPQEQAAAPTNPQNLREELQVAKSKGLGGGALYLASRPWEVGLDEMTNVRNPVTALGSERYWAHNWAESSPANYGEQVRQYRERKAQLERELMQAPPLVDGKPNPENFELRKQMNDLDKQMIGAFFKRGVQGAMERGAPIYGQSQAGGDIAKGRAAYREWQQNEAQRSWNAYLNKTPAQ